MAILLSLRADQMAPNVRTASWDTSSVILSKLTGTQTAAVDNTGRRTTPTAKEE